MGKLIGGGLGALLVLYAGIASFVAVTWSGRRNAERTVLLRAQELATQHTAELAEKPPREPLETACAGKLKLEGVYDLAGYSLRAKGTGAPNTFSDDSSYLDVHHEVVGFKSPNWEKGDPVTTSSKAESIGPELSFGSAFVEALDPNGWKYRLDQKAQGPYPDTRPLRFLAVTAVSDLAFPEIGADTYSAGRAELHTRVLTFPGGEVLCEGRSSPLTPKRVEMTGRGSNEGEAELAASSRVRFHVNAYFKGSLLWTPLDRLCEARGKELCMLTASEARRSQ